MTAPTSHLHAARTLGVPVTEISDVASSPAGTVIVTTDGVSYIDVPAGKPDSEGKSGLMYLSAPGETYTGSFPVYALPADDDTAKPATAAAAAVTAATKSAAAAERGPLVARAKELGLKINGRTKTETIAQLIADAEAALDNENADDSAAGDGDDGDADGDDGDADGDDGDAE